jgi:hypothetical protein
MPAERATHSPITFPSTPAAPEYILITDAPPRTG